MYYENLMYSTDEGNAYLPDWKSPVDLGVEDLTAVFERRIEIPELINLSIKGEKRAFETLVDVIWITMDCSERGDAIQIAKNWVGSEETEIYYSEPKEGYGLCGIIEQ